jgi:hypothetical protein
LVYDNNRAVTGLIELVRAQSLWELGRIWPTQSWVVVFKRKHRQSQGRRRAMDQGGRVFKSIIICDQIGFGSRGRNQHYPQSDRIAIAIETRSSEAFYRYELRKILITQTTTTTTTITTTFYKSGTNLQIMLYI